CKSDEGVESSALVSRHERRRALPAKTTVGVSGTGWRRCSIVFCIQRRCAGVRLCERSSTRSGEFAVPGKSRCRPAAARMRSESTRECNSRRKKDENERNARHCHSQKSGTRAKRKRKSGRLKASGGSSGIRCIFSCFLDQIDV